MAGEVLDPEPPERLARRPEVARRAVRLPLEVDLAELRADEAVGGQVGETVHDHLGRVEVALREHEGTRGGGVHGGVAVGCDEPDEVVALRARLEERAALGVDERHARVLAEVAAVVREMSGEERVRRRVQLDPGHVAGVEVERGEDLVPASRADDRDAGRGPEEAEGEGAVLVVEAREGRRVAVVALHHRAERAVVAQEDRVRVGDAEDVEAEDGAPAREEDVKRVVGLGSHRLDRVGDRVREPVREDGPEQEPEGEQAARNEQDAETRGRQARPGEGEQEAGEHDAAGRRDQGHQRDAGGAAEPGPEEVGEVEPIDARRLGREDRCQRQAAGQERCEHRGAHERELHGFIPPAPPAPAHEPEGVQLRPGDEQVAQQDGRTRGDAAERHGTRGRVPAQARKDRHEHAPRPQAEQRDADDQVGEVVHELEGEDARVAHLQ